MNDIFAISLASRAQKDLKKVPLYVALKLQAWIEAVGHQGLWNVRKIKGYHDELLQGKRFGQRSIRLSQSYRAIYIIKNQVSFRLIEIIEVTKHGY